MDAKQLQNWRFEQGTSLLVSYLFPAVKVYRSSLPPFYKGTPHNKNLLAPIQNFLNTYLKGANTYRN